MFIWIHIQYSPTQLFIRDKILPYLKSTQNITYYLRSFSPIKLLNRLVTPVVNGGLYTIQ